MTREPMVAVSVPAQCHDSVRPSPSDHVAGKRQLRRGCRGGEGAGYKFILAAVGSQQCRRRQRRGRGGLCVPTSVLHGCGQKLHLSDTHLAAHADGDASSVARTGPSACARSVASHKSTDNGHEKGHKNKRSWSTSSWTGSVAQDGCQEKEVIRERHIGHTQVEKKCQGKLHVAIPIVAPLTFPWSHFLTL